MDPTFVQKQIRDNADELQDYLRDLNSWNDNISNTDNKLTRSASNQSAPVDNPIRNVDTGHKDIQEAIVYKERGNQFYKEGKYEEATKCYTKAIERDPTNAIFVANRAMTHLKRGRHEAAETDCTSAIRLDPSYAKAYQRRATARTALKRLKEAIADYEKVIDLEPQNKAAKLELEKIERSFKNPSKSATKAASSDFYKNIKNSMQTSSLKNTKKEESVDPAIVKPIVKPPHKRSKQPLRRIEIQDVFDASSDISQPGRNATTKNQDSNMDLEYPSVKSDASSSQKENLEVLCNEIKRTNITAKEIKKPRTYIQFCSLWKEIDDIDRVKLLAQFDSSDYLRIFKNSLDPDMFSDVIKTICSLKLRQSYPVFIHLLGLSQVHRFRSLILFTSAEEKDMIKEAFQHIEHHEDVSSENLSKVLKLYEV